jgi:tetratricopeptide (TPR) repeat protein
MIRRLHVIVFFLSFATLSIAKDNHFENGRKAFDKEDFKTAVTFFETDLNEHPNNVSGWFNLGLAYNAEKKYSDAIWAFEKVLKHRPNDVEAIDNIIHNYTELGNGLEWQSDLTHFQRSTYGMGSNFWSISAIVLSIITAVLIFALRKKIRPNNKKLLIFSAAFTFLIMISCIVLGQQTRSFEQSNEYGIITKAIPEHWDASIGPYNKNDKRVQLPIGTKVKVLSDKKNSIIDIESSTGKKATVRSSEIRFI